MEWFDLGVIGGGPGGYVAAEEAARLGFSVVLFEKEALGGVCLHKGCIPTKALLKSAGLCEALAEAGEYGVGASAPRVDIGQVTGRMRGVVETLHGGVQALLQAAGVRVVMAEARLLDRHTIEAGGRHWMARKVILATGSRPVVPQGLEGFPSAVTSDDLLAAEEIPASLAILGGGVIGVEFARLMAGLGSRVSLFEAAGQLLPGAEPEMARLVAQSLEARGVTVQCGVTLEAQGDTLVCKIAGGQAPVTAARLLVATGRQANLEAAGIPALGLQLRENRVQTDPAMRTSLAGVYAIGDLTSGPMLAHKASAEGRIAARAAAGLPTAPLGPVPCCVYANPELAWIGIGEAEAQARSVTVATVPMRHNGRALAESGGQGFIKLIADRSTGGLLGAHLACAHATELVSLFCLAIQAEACVEELAAALYPHPSLSEAVHEAARALQSW